MSRMKSIFAGLLLTAVVSIVPQVQAQTFKTIIAGSSGMWQALGVGAYNNGTSIVSGGGATFHWTSASNAVNLTDTRVSPVNNDGGTLWNRERHPSTLAWRNRRTAGDQRSWSAFDRAGPLGAAAAGDFNCFDGALCEAPLVAFVVGLAALLPDLPAVALRVFEAGFFAAVADPVPAAFPEVLMTSSRTGAGMAELRAAMVRLLEERS